MAGTLAGTMATCIKKASEFAANRKFKISLSILKLMSTAHLRNA